MEIITGQNCITSKLSEYLLKDKKMRVDGGYGVIAAYTNEMEEYEILRSGIGIIDLSAVGRFKISGNQHVEFMSEMVSKDIEFLDVEKCIFTLLLNEEGQVLDLVSLYKQDEAIIIETSAMKRNVIWSWLVERKIEEVELQDLSLIQTIIGFEGPYAWKLAQSLVDFEISSLPYQSFVEIECKGQDILFIRSGVTGEYGYKILVPNDLAILFWETLINFVEDDIKVAPVGMDALEITMLEVRQPNINVEGSGISVFEACIEWFISFHKDSFVGLNMLNILREEAVERRLIGFTFDAELSLCVSDKVLIEEVNMGQIVQVSYSPSLGKNLGLALIDQKFAVSGIKLEGLNQMGERVVITTQSSPYVLPKSWSIKII